MKKILVVVDSINVNDSSGSKCNVALIINMIKAGYNVKVYHHSRKDISINGAHCVKINVNKFNWIYILGGFLRFLNRNFNLITTPFIERKIGFSPAFLSDVHDFTRTLKKDSFNPDLVITLSKAASFRPHKALLNIKEWHSKWLAYVHDPFPFHFYPKPYDFYAPGYKYKEQFLINFANKAAYSGFPSLLLKEWMGKFAPDFLNKGVVIPHQLVEIENKEIQLPEFFNRNKFTLLHAGSLLGQRNPKGLIEGFFKFLESNPEANETAQLILIGSISENHSDTFNKHKNKRDNLISINKNLPFDVVYQLQYSVSVNIILEAKSDISPFLPGKFPHCVAANKKMLVLGPENSETRRLLGNDYEYFSEIDNVDVISKLIEKLYFEWKANPNEMLLNKPELLDYLGANNLKFIIDTLLND
ncbi:glycosyltransferase family protein [Flavobacterium urocaniciphilum]|uniref:Uncharacterized protein n=1 Tax=Flavobacterium urocaniciphilum TaxID=1299341 RepID=A0A1H8YRP4_9FLAO|nr:glycosyltransferase family 4 protein [Flavobacterium urocaniciphilum]SEP54885.1 hypothetical protein SAMN05444005_10180 [Flavobacterium urocaniciphilum]